jgi:ABC-type nitrate/sulfonate/bicarbonate transport system substrate-binding protein
MTMLSRRLRALLMTAAVAAVATPISAHAEDMKLQMGLPGVPPVYVAVLQYVARDAGFFKKYGLDVNLRGFDSGTVAARAVQTGDIDVSLSPTPVVIGITSNAGVDMVAIFGMENNDFELASTDPKIKACADVKGQSVSVDTINGARSIALHQMIASCGLKASDVQEVALGSNTAQAMAAGQLSVGVLHIDDVPVIEQQGKKKLTVITTLKKTNPINHYMVLTAQRSEVQKKRDAFVRLVAANIEAARFMKDPKNADKVGQIAAVTGHSPAEAKAALAEFNEIEFWPLDSDGLAKNKVEAAINVQVKTGGIREGKTPITYDKLVDPSIWRDAEAMVKAHGGK